MRSFDDDPEVFNWVEGEPAPKPIGLTFKEFVLASIDEWREPIAQGREP
jgi:hypothetical protein